MTTFTDNGVPNRIISMHKSFLVKLAILFRSKEAAAANLSKCSSSMPIFVAANKCFCLGDSIQNQAHRVCVLIKIHSAGVKKLSKGNNNNKSPQIIFFFNISDKSSAQDKFVPIDGVSDQTPPFAELPMNGQISKKTDYADCSSCRGTWKFSTRANILLHFPTNSN